jgi:hypothetical protein
MSGPNVFKHVLQRHRLLPQILTVTVFSIQNGHAGLRDGSFGRATPPSVLRDPQFLHIHMGFRLWSNPHFS